ncbi:hypothetical protein SCB29_40425, partial [Paraburkholderia sp. SIMBA_055]
TTVARKRGRADACAMSENLTFGKRVAARAIRAAHAASELPYYEQPVDGRHRVGVRHPHATVQALERNPDVEQIALRVESLR